MQMGTWSYATLRGRHGPPAALALLDQLVVGGANFVTILLLGRLAGPHALGVYALVMTVFYLLLAVQEALITTPYTIFGARLSGIRHRQYSGSALCQSAGWSACVASILALIASYFGFVSNDSELARVVGVFSIVAPLWLLREFGRRYLFARMQLTKVVAMSVTGASAQLTTLCLFAYTDRLSPATALCAMGVGSGAAGIGWLWLSRRSFQLNHARLSYFVRKNWVLGRWVLASQGTSVIAANMMPWLIVLWLGPAATGIFAACDAILRFANPIIIALTNVLTPRVAIGFKHGGEAELRRIIRKATILLGLFLFAFCLFLAIAGELVLQQSFGDDYAGYWATLLVLAINQLVAKLALAPGRALLVLERANIILRAEAAGFATSLAAATMLIPLYGVLGAAFSLLAGSLAITVVTVGVYLAVMRDGGGEGLLRMGPPTATPAPAGGHSE